MDASPLSCINTKWKNMFFYDSSIAYAPTQCRWSFYMIRYVRNNPIDICARYVFTSGAHGAGKEGPTQHDI